MTAEDWKRRSVYRRGEIYAVRERIVTHFVVLGDFTNETLEWQLADQEFGRLLIATDFTESDGTGAEAMRLLDTSSSRHGRLTGLLGSELLARGLATGRLAGGLLLDGDKVVRSVEESGYQWDRQQRPVTMTAWQ